MAQQTAGEWLMNKSLKHTYILNTEYVKDKRIIIELDEFINLYELAKQMEKEQIMNAWYSGYEDNRQFVDYSEDYYNKTYGENKD